MKMTKRAPLLRELDLRSPCIYIFSGSMHHPVCVYSNPSIELDRPLVHIAMHPPPFIL